MVTHIIDYARYSGCIALENESTRVVLGPHCGGRVLEYALNGENALHRDPAQDGWVYTPGIRPGPLCPTAGRCDIGPEHIVPKRPELWLGGWQGEIVNDNTARMVSPPCDSMGTRLTREFTLAEGSSHLTYTQTQENISDHETRWCHWSRTFGRGHGICVVPLTPKMSRFPQQYVMYGPGPVINFQPNDPHIRVRDGYLEVFDTPANPKLGLDSYAGWFGYLMPHNVLLIKGYTTYPDRVYNEMAGLTISLYYLRDVVCELEPIGPMEVLAPGASASFTEEWWLTPCAFPEQRNAADLAAIGDVARKAMQS